jgi:molybdopterin-binding protein
VIKSVTPGNIVMEVLVSVGPTEPEAAVMSASAERLGPKPGGAVSVVVKFTDVLIDTWMTQSRPLLELAG